MSTLTRGEAAREAMLDAAEQIASESGIGAITLSGVQQRAGQGNKSAATYHFGSRHGLLSALMARRMRPIDEHRRVLLAELSSNPSLDDLVEALVRPLVDATREPGSLWCRFMAQAFSDPLLGELVLGHPEASSIRDVHRLLHDALTPGLAPEVAEHRIAATLGMLVATLALHEGHPAWYRSHALADDLVRLCLAVLTAPTS